MRAQMLFAKMKSESGEAATDRGESVTDVALMKSFVSEAQTVLAWCTVS